MHALASPLHMLGLLAASLSAQATYIVDINNGPGTNFVQIQAAVTAVPSGSVLLVRAGLYQPVDIDGKALVVLCAAGTSTGTAIPSLFIRNTTTSQAVTVHRLGGVGGCRIQNAQGPVTIESCGPYDIPPSSGAVGLHAIQSRQVAVRSVVAHGNPGARANDSVVVFEGCQLTGFPGFWTEPFSQLSAVGLDMVRSRVELVHTTVRGGDGHGGFAGSAAVEMTLQPCTLVARGLAQHSLRGGSTSGALGYCIHGVGTAIVVPQIPMIGNPLVSTYIALTRPELPSLVSTAGVPGTNLVTNRWGTPGSLYAVAIALPTPWIAFPGLGDPFWLDGASLTVEAVGIAPPVGPVGVVVPVPSQASLRGFMVAWQAADLDTTGLLRLSNPSPSFVY